MYILLLLLFFVEIERNSDESNFKPNMFCGHKIQNIRKDKTVILF